MSVNHKNQEERISVRVNEEVRTPIGDVLVTYSARTGELVASFHPRYARRLVESEATGGTSPEMRVKLGEAIPAKGDEVTQDGRTFVVKDVSIDEDSGRVMLFDELSGWTTWKRSIRSNV